MKIKIAKMTKTSAIPWSAHPMEALNVTNGSKVRLSNLKTLWNSLNSSICKPKRPKEKEDNSLKLK